jgi:hypothetical protein
VLQTVRRVLIIFGALAAAAVAISVLIALASHGDVEHAISVAFYVTGAAVLVGCFVVGARGPIRPEWGDDRRGSAFLPRGVRKASAEERIEGRKLSVFLFALGLVFVILGTAIDPAHRLF